MKMTIRPNGMKVRNRKGFLIKVVCIIFFCSLIIYALHFYRKVYNFTSNRSFLFGKLGEAPYGNNIIMENVGSEFGSVPVAGSSQGDQIQGAPVINLENKVVHFDLKGMPPNMKAFEQILPFLKNIGVTGLLMEYEDMFPFEGKLQGIRNEKSYTPDDIRQLLKWAKSLNLDVIPLVQTFGHLEFLLKIEEFSSLREVPKFPQVICPTNNRSRAIITDMIDQVMELHPEIKYLHIGSDEVYYLGMCALCQDRMAHDKIEQADLFLDHAKFIASYVKDKFKVQPLMWDDEFRNVDERLIESSGIGNIVEIVVWNYLPDVRNQLHPLMWSKYSKLFKSVWAGSAFKGANKPNSITVNETFYLSNHYSWMSVISENQHRTNFKGIVLTGWQRYDHFSVLCEILPVAIPSLVSCMLYLTSKGQPTMEKIFGEVSTLLQCESNKMLCEFPGSNVYTDVTAMANLQNTLQHIKEQNVFLGWTQEVNFRLQFSNPGHVESILQGILKLKYDLQRIQTSLVDSLKTWFPDWSVYEWMMTNYDPVAKEVKKLEEKLQKLSKKRVFPVRPLTYPEYDADGRTNT